MALIFIQTPEQYTPGYNENVFQSSGTTSGKNNYQYIFNIYDYTGTTALVPPIKIPPRLSDNAAVFDAGRIIESYLASDIAILGSGSEGVKTNDNSYYAYKVKVGEEYDLSTTGVTSYPDIITSSGVVYAWNAAYPFQEFHDFSPLNIIGLSGGSDKLKGLSSVKDIMTAQTYKPVNMDENEWMYVVNAYTNNVSKIVVETYNFITGMGSAKSYAIDNPYKAISNNQDRFIRFPVGTRNLNRVPSGSITTSESLPIIQSDVKYYNVWTADGSNNVTSDVWSYKIPDNYDGNTCTKYDEIRVHFLNKWGGFDSFTFNKVSRTNEEIERKQYKKIYGSTSGRWLTNTFDRGITNYNTSIKDTMTLNSDWITEAEAAWLEELVASPEVYWDNNDELWAINITNTSYEKRKTVNDKIFNLTVEVELTQKRFTQRF